MPTSLDVAEYILQQKGPVSSMKLQKLVYYSQAWSLALEEEPLFDEPIEAWANGPVVKNLIINDPQQSYVSTLPQGDPGKLTSDQKEIIDTVIIYYGQKSSQWLQTQTHAEAPWRQARMNTVNGNRPELRQPGNQISPQAMKDYYSGLEGHC